MAESNALVALLEKDYSPPLDTATFLAILSDYDVDNPDELQAARQILDSVTEGIDAEEATGFDPSGSSGREGNGNSKSQIEAESESGHSQPGWSSNTDNTSVSQGMSALDLEGLEFLDAQNGTDDETDGKKSDLSEKYNAQLEGLDGDSKEAVLIETFPGLKPFDIKWTLNKCKGNAGLAIEELLNQVFLEDSGNRYRGIEAFSESDIPPRPRKCKGRKKRSGISESDSTPETEILLSGTTESKWESSRRDVQFLSSRTGMPMLQVSSLYHKNGASVPRTITAIIKAHLPLDLEPEDATINVHAQELSQEFRTIPFMYILALTHLTHPSTASAHELAVALATSPQQARTGTPIQIEFRLAPPDISEPISKLKPKSHNTVFNFDSPSPGPPYTNSTSDIKDFINLRDEAFTRASAAYRKSRSDHLMSGAAAYYSSLGRDYDAKAKSASSAAADSLVASQSSSTHLDLHGINVKDAVRIARENVTAWWARNGDAPHHAGYRIVTGRGTHSEGGKGKLGPAVGKMLIREGWKVEVGNGVLVVTGLVGRR